MSQEWHNWILPITWRGRISQVLWAIVQFPYTSINFQLSSLMGCIRRAFVIIRFSLPLLCTTPMVAFQQHTFSCMRVPWGENQMQPYNGNWRCLFWCLEALPIGTVLLFYSWKVEKRIWIRLSSSAVIFQMIRTDRSTANARIKCYHMFGSYVFLLEVVFGSIVLSFKNAIYFCWRFKTMPLKICWNT